MKPMKLLLIPLIFSLAACSSQKHTVVDSKTFTTKDGSTVKISYGYFENAKDRTETLHIINPSHTAAAVAGATLGSVFTLALGGGLATFSKEQLNGEVTNLPNVAYTYAFPTYAELVKNNLVMKRTDNYTDVPIYIYPHRFSLIYNALTGSDNTYTLHTGFDVVVGNKHLKENYYNARFKCTKERTGKTKEEWVANNYQLIIDEAKNLLDRCFATFEEHHFNALASDMLN